MSQNATVFTIVDSSHILPESLSASGTEVLTGVDLVLPLNVTLGSTPVTVIGKYSSALFPSDWVLGSQQLLQILTGKSDAEFNFAVSKGLTAGDIATLRANGFSVQPMTGIIPFLDSGVGEIEDDATWVLLPSSFVIAILAYAFTGSETADRRHDIGIVKTIGAGRRRVMSYLLANALLISAWGGLLGLALGIILSYGVSTLASSMFTSVFVIKASASLLALSYLATVGAGVAGAAIPAAKMTLSSPVSDLKEVTPLS
jgi:ABC-type antimicrobial peptide transport system permease subunit